MKVETEERGAHTVVRLRGTVALGEATGALAEAFTRIEKEKAGALIVDLTHLKTLDSTALGLLVGSQRRLHSANRDLILVNPGRRVAALLSMTKLDTVFSIHPTLAQAFELLERKTTGETDRDYRRPDNL